MNMEAHVRSHGDMATAACAKRYSGQYSFRRNRIDCCRCALRIACALETPMLIIMGCIGQIDSARWSVLERFFSLEPSPHPHTYRPQKLRDSTRGLDVSDFGGSQGTTGLEQLNALFSEGLAYEDSNAVRGLLTQDRL